MGLAERPGVTWESAGHLAALPATSDRVWIDQLPPPVKESLLELRACIFNICDDFTAMTGARSTPYDAVLIGFDEGCRNGHWGTFKRACGRPNIRHTSFSPAWLLELERIGMLWTDEFSSAAAK